MNIVSLIKPHPLSFLPPGLGKNLSHNLQALGTRAVRTAPDVTVQGHMVAFFKYFFPKLE